MYKVLLVDDEPIIVEGLSRSIPWERWNCRVVATANDGTEGKNLIEKERPDIVFMDICMPEMNGLQMIAALNSQFPDLEVSVLTGYRRTNTAIRYLENRLKSTIIRKKYDSAEEKCEKKYAIYIDSRDCFRF